MKLVDVYDVRPATRANHILYDLLKERTPEQSISHTKMPTWPQHVKFVNSRPYEHWYFIEVSDMYVGACYLTKQREVGVFIFNDSKGHKYGLEAVKMLMKKHPRTIYANVNPENKPSIKLWESLGFKCIQWTYKS